MPAGIKTRAAVDAIVSEGMSLGSAVLSATSRPLGDVVAHHVRDKQRKLRLSTTPVSSPCAPVSDLPGRTNSPSGIIGPIAKSPDWVYASFNARQSDFGQTGSHDTPFAALRDALQADPT